MTSNHTEETRNPSRKSKTGVSVGVIAAAMLLAVATVQTASAEGFSEDSTLDVTEQSPVQVQPPAYTQPRNQLPPAPAHSGPKKSVAVAKFDANGAFVGQYGSYDVGGGLSAMMVSELGRTGRFNVVERADLGVVLKEQEYSLRGLTAAKTVKAGRLLGAQFLIRGSVTEFEMAESGGGISFGVNLGGFLAALSPQTRSGRVTVDIRIIDSTTGQVVHSFTTSQKISETAIAGSLSHSGLSFGANSFDRTPIGQAARMAIRKAVVQIVNAMANVPWEGVVAKVRGKTIYVNSGADTGLRQGDVLQVVRVVDRVVDPVTGQVLGVEVEELGQATVVSVKDRYATARYKTFSRPKIGDTLRLVQNAWVSPDAKIGRAPGLAMNTHRR